MPLASCFGFILLVLALLSIPIHQKNAYALDWRQARIQVPPQCSVEVSQARVVPVDAQAGVYKVYLKKEAVYPLSVTVTDLFGAHIEFYIKDPIQLQNLVIPEKIIKTPYANPIAIFDIPKLCSRVNLLQVGGSKRLLYDGAKDLLDFKPSMQNFDSDYQGSASQHALLRNFDDKNTLSVNRIQLSYDYEDNNIVDYQGPNPVTKEPEVVYEGEGGFYANFHYAVIPYDEKFSQLNRQEILHLAQGKLAEINRLDVQPRYRTHSFLPGPYESKESVYELCEWGDTTFHSKKQELFFENFPLWDWDLTDASGKPIDKVILIIWEGDEEAWMITAGLLDPFYIADDVVGVFTIRKNQTVTPLKLVNSYKNFEIEVVSVP